MSSGLLGSLVLNFKLNIDNFSANLKQVENDVKGTKDKLSGFSSVGDSFTKAGKTLTVGLTAPIIGAGVAGINTAASLEENMTQISTIADTTKVPIEDLKQAIINLSNDTGQSTATLAAGMYDAISSGVDTADVVQFLTVAVKDAKGGFTDTAVAVDGLTSVLNAYGKQTGEATKLSNEMMVAQNLGKTTFGEMSQYMGDVAPTAAALKVETNELFSSLAVLTANGIKTGQSCTSLKAAFSNIIKPSKQASDVAKTLGFEFNASAVATKGWKGFLMDVKDKLSQMAPEYTNAIERQGQLNTSLSKLEKEGKKNTDQYKKMKEELKKVSGDIKLLEGGSNSTISAFGTMFGSTEALNSILTLTSTQGMTLYDESMRQMGGSTDYVEEAFNKMNNTTSANFQQTKQQFKNTLGEIGAMLLPAVNKILDSIKGLMEGFRGLSPETKSFIVTLLGIVATVGPILLVTGTIMGSIAKIGTGVKTIQGLWKIIKGLKIVTSITTGFAKIKSVMNLTSITGLLTSKAFLIVAGIATIIAIVVLLIKNWDKVKEKAIEVWGYIKDYIKEKLDAIGEFFTNLKNKISDTINKIINFIKEHKAVFIGALLGPVGLVVGLIIDNWDTIKNKTSEIFGKICNKVSDSFKDMRASVSSGLKTVKEYFFKGLDFLINLPKNALTWGKDMVDGFVNGIKSSVGKLVGSIKTMAGNIRSLMHFSRPDEGPLRDYETWMPDFMEGLGKGIDSNSYRVLNPIKNLAKNMSLNDKLSLQPNLGGNINGYSSSGNISSQYISNAPIMNVENLHVNSRQDIDDISRAIYNENMKVIRGFGRGI